MSISRLRCVVASAALFAVAAPGAQAKVVTGSATSPAGSSAGAAYQDILSFEFSSSDAGELSAKFTTAAEQPGRPTRKTTYQNVTFGQWNAETNSCIGAPVVFSSTNFDDIAFVSIINNESIGTRETAKTVTGATTQMVSKRAGLIGHTYNCAKLTLSEPTPDEVKLDEVIARDPLAVSTPIVTAPTCKRVKLTGYTYKAAKKRIHKANCRIGTVKRLSSGNSATMKVKKATRVGSKYNLRIG